MRTPCYETLTLIFSLGLIRARRYPRLASKDPGPDGPALVRPGGMI